MPPEPKALRDLFRLETNKELQITILSELVKTGAADDLPFLQQLQEDQDAGVRLAAERTLLHLQGQVVA